MVDRGHHPGEGSAGTRRFYEDVLGCKVEREAPAGITYRTGDSFFDLYPTQFAGTAQHTIAGFVVDDVEASVKELTAKGVTFEQYDMPGLKTDENGIAELGGGPRREHPGARRADPGLRNSSTLGASAAPREAGTAQGISRSPSCARH